MINTRHPLMTEWFELTETLHATVQKKLAKPNTFDYIYLSRFHFKISQHLVAPISETEFAKLLTLMILIIYTQSAHINKERKKDFGNDWFNDWFLLHFFLTGSLDTNYSGMIRSSESNPSLLIAFYEAMDIIIIPPELKICMMGINTRVEPQQDIIPIIETYITHFYPHLFGTPWPSLTRPTSSDFLIDAFNTLSSKPLKKPEYIPYRSLAKNTLQHPSPQPRLG